MRKIIGLSIVGFLTACLMLGLLSGCSSDRSEDPKLNSLEARPSRIVVTGRVGGGQTTQQQFVVSGTVDNMWFRMSTTSSWIVNLRPDTTKTFTPVPIRFEADAFNLLPGTYIDSIRLDSPGAANSPLYVLVEFTVAPVLQAAPGQLGFLLIPGVSNPSDSQLVEVTSASGNQIDYNAKSNSLWLQLSQSIGSTPDSIWVSVDRAGLEPGIYVDTIILSAPDIGAVETSILCSLRVRAWLEQEGNINLDLEEVDFVDSLHGWTVGGGGGAQATGGIVMSTVDGGEVWKLTDNLNFGRLGTVDFVTVDSGWMADDSGSIYRTIDGGQSWAAQTTTTENGLRDITFLDVSEGWVVGDNGIILHTVDAGENWTVQTTPGPAFALSSVSFIDANNGWTVGDFGTIFHTIDGGSNWVLQDDNGNDRDLWGVYAISASECWAVGKLGSVLHTVDGGQIWNVESQIPTLGSLRSVYFSDQMEGWIVGESGTVLHTVDAGVEWRLQKSDVTVTLKSVIFVGTEQGWAVGQKGTIIHTFAGGE